MATIELHRAPYIGTSFFHGITRHWVTTDGTSGDDNNPGSVLGDRNITGNVQIGHGHPFDGNLLADNFSIVDQDEDLPTRYLMEVTYLPPADTVTGGLTRQVPGFSAAWRFNFLSANLPLHQLRAKELKEGDALGKLQNIGGGIYKAKPDQQANVEFVATVGNDDGTESTTSLFYTGHNTSVGYDGTNPASTITATKTTLMGTGNFFKIQNFLGLTNSDGIFGQQPGHVQFVAYSVDQVDDLFGSRRSGFSWRVSLTWLLAAVRLDKVSHGSSFRDEDGNDAVVTLPDGTPISKSFKVETQVDMSGLVNLF